MGKISWRLIVPVLLVGVVACAIVWAEKDNKKGRRRAKPAAAVSEESERNVTEAEVPRAAKAALVKLARGAEITEFAEEIEHGHTFYEGSWKAPSGAKIDALVTPTGDLVEIEREMDADKVPAAVRKAARRAAGDGGQLTFEKKTMILYEVKFHKGDSRYELLLTPDGRRVGQEIEKGKTQGDDEDDDEGDDDEDEDDEDDEGEEQVSINDVPKAVKATILEHANGGRIEKIERENEDGKTIYEAEVIIDGKEFELKVARNGKLLSKEADDEDDDKGDEDDDDDEGEDED